ncbi:hypothetical protein Hanom_Chr14g01289711 [Helianthus anomalus]
MAEFENLRWRRDFARYEIRKLYDPFVEEVRAKRWDAKRECYSDPQGNLVVDPEGGFQ